MREMTPAVIARLLWVATSENWRSGPTRIDSGENTVNRQYDDLHPMKVLNRSTFPEIFYVMILKVVF